MPGHIVKTEKFINIWWLLFNLNKSDSVYNYRVATYLYFAEHSQDKPPIVKKPPTSITSHQ